MEEKIQVIENDKNQNVDDFYVNLKKRLEETHTFPTNYLFKYIVPSNPSIIARLHLIFGNSNPSISSKESKNGNYTSVTIKVPVNDANDVIIYYRQASEIEGIVML